MLAASAVGRMVRTAWDETRRFVAHVLWPATAHVVTELWCQVAGVVTRAQRSAPAWLAARRARAVLLAGAVEEATRRSIRSAWRHARADAISLRRELRRRRWARRTVRAGGVVAVLLIVGLLAFGPLLRLTARVVVGDDTRDELPPLEQTSVVVSDGGTPLGLVEREHRRTVDTRSLPDHVTNLVLAAEDNRFRSHHGYDLEGMARAAVTNARAGEVEQGGSTITQQLAKLNFTGNDASLSRKVEELLYAVRLEDELSKDQLLERYVNQVYFGNGAHGIAAAAEEYFGVQPSDLSVAQAATLAGIIRAPNALDPRRDPELVRRRRDAVLRRAADAGLVPREKAAAAMAKPLGVTDPAPRPPTDPVVGAVRAEVQTIDALGATPEERLERFETGGLWVETTVDPALEQSISSSIDAAFPGGDGATAAVAAVDPVSGAIRALRSGRDAPGGFDLARQGRRQPGSTFKPLTAVAGLEAGLSPSQRLVGNGPIELEYGGPELWRVDNFEGSDAGRVDLAEALRRSVNTAFAQLGTAVGPEAIIDVADRLGIDVEAAFGTRDQWGPSVAIGGVARGVSPLEMASAYTAFANNGQRAEPYLVERIRESDGDVIYEHDPKSSPAVDPTIANEIRGMLEAVVRSGTGSAARIDGVAAFGKTGTSQDAADAWFVGSTTNLTTAVWVGHPDDRVPMPGSHRRFGGGTAVARDHHGVGGCAPDGLLGAPAGRRPPGAGARPAPTSVSRRALHPWPRLTDAHTPPARPEATRSLPARSEPMAPAMASGSAPADRSTDAASSRAGNCTARISTNRSPTGTSRPTAGHEPKNGNAPGERSCSTSRPSANRMPSSVSRATASGAPSHDSAKVAGSRAVFARCRGQGRPGARINRSPQTPTERQRTNTASSERAISARCGAATFCLSICRRNDW